MEEEIFVIGNQMVACGLNCAGIIRNPDQGIIPRCLILELEGRDVKAPGCIVVGLNPGGGHPAEFNFYLENGNTYESVVNFWHDPPLPNQGRFHPYYVRLRAMVDKMGIEGPILWTELAKCQGGDLPVDTFRKCIRNFLTREILALSQGWEIIAACKEAFQKVPYMFLGRSIIGVPHPTGFGGFPFLNLFVGGNINNNLMPEIVHQLRHRNHNQVLWLNVKDKRQVLEHLRNMGIDIRVVDLLNNDTEAWSLFREFYSLPEHNKSQEWYQRLNLMLLRMLNLE